LKCYRENKQCWSSQTASKRQLYIFLHFTWWN
jgi:hypothetical protein